LSQKPDDLKWAKGVYERAKKHYHYISKSSVEGVLYK